MHAGTHAMLEPTSQFGNDEKAVDSMYVCEKRNIDPSQAEGGSELKNVHPKWAVVSQLWYPGRRLKKLAWITRSR